jgi:hypothetical protein
LLLLLPLLLLLGSTPRMAAAAAAAAVSAAAVAAASDAAPTRELWACTTAKHTKNAKESILQFGSLHSKQKLTQNVKKIYIYIVKCSYFTRGQGKHAVALGPAVRHDLGGKLARREAA